MEKQNLKKVVAEKLKIEDMPEPSKSPSTTSMNKKKVTSIEVVNGKVIVMFSEGGIVTKKVFNNFQEFADYADNFFGLNKGGGIPEDELEAGGNPFAQLKNKNNVEGLTKEEEELV